MNRISDVPSLSDGNKLYLYRLLRDGIGVGKQTFAPRVEEVLATEHLEPATLGFPSTRELLEQLSEAVDLTVFKGGRVYATLRAVPAWDAALDAAATGKDADKTGARAGGRPYRKKKGAKALRPVRPRRMTSEEPQTVSEKPKEGSGNSSDESAKAEEISVGAADKTAPDGTVSGPDNAPAREHACAPVTAGEDAGSEPSAPAEVAGPASAPATETTEAESTSGAASTVQTGEATEIPQAPVSGIQLTVTYDPYAGIEGEQALTATIRDTRAAEPAGGPKVANAQAAEPADDPGPTRATSSRPAMATGEGMRDAAVEARALPDRPAPARNPAKQPFPARTGAEQVALAPAVPAQTVPEHAPAQAPAEPAAAPAATASAAGGPAPSALALKGYPRDLARELRVPATLLGVLVRIVPMGSDALAELTEDFRVARGAGTVTGARARATFPLRHAGEHGEPVMATIRRQADRTGSGSTWELAELEGASPDLIAAAGIEGLPILADGPWFENAASPAAALAASPRRRFALLAYTGDEILAELARLACPRVWDEASLRAQLSFAAAAAGLDPDDPEGKPSSGPDGKRTRTTFPTGLFTDAGKPISAVLEPTGDDIPYRLTGFLTA